MATPDADPPHEHRWRGVEFYLEDDHPFLLQSCECGTQRSRKDRARTVPCGYPSPVSTIETMDASAVRPASPVVAAGDGPAG